MYKRSVAVPIKQKVIYSPAKNNRSSSGWFWPVSGRVSTTFIPDQGKKGINIACKKGERVLASAGGVVAYAGSGLSGYGNLIIIKHNNEYLTAYGNNERNLVKEGQKVKPGQVIATAGVIDRKYWGVHFEIRKKGIPVNPLNYLQKG
jgi:lipoprotein NlpD